MAKKKAWLVTFPDHNDQFISYQPTPQAVARELITLGRAIAGAKVQSCNPKQII